MAYRWWKWTYFLFLNASRPRTRGHWWSYSPCSFSIRVMLTMMTWRPNWWLSFRSPRLIWAHHDMHCNKSHELAFVNYFFYHLKLLPFLSPTIQLLDESGDGALRFCTSSFQQNLAILYLFCPCQPTWTLQMANSFCTLFYTGSDGGLNSSDEFCAAMKRLVSQHPRPKQSSGSARDLLCSVVSLNCHSEIVGIKEYSFICFELPFYIHQETAKANRQTDSLDRQRWVMDRVLLGDWDADRLSPRLTECAPKLNCI